MRFALLGVALLGLAACADRNQPGGSVFDPVCMPDGSVVLSEYKRADGSYDETTAKRENCIWYRAPAKS
jgi:hypothetical protein